ncbi:hypothetical protein J2128_002393 [Methanomicrobium sp. W14]|uniref:hypothetical protein n=1 Tax=Methanomicrobium sp. W14 TaxID=2817839 RepID=UPI001AE24422|nr:hypothetical protein [Methanomicrobium sp. W14]MBP2134427.1 hypothetical protein [Methanomicrobium sp. W14]
MKKSGFLLFIAAAVLCITMCTPASAVLLEEKYQGQVSLVDQSTDTITMKVAFVYEGGEWITYAKSSLKNNLVSGTMSNPDAFKDLKQGDNIEATLMGGSEWISIGEIGDIGSTETPLTAAYGDPSVLTSKFYSGYTLSAEMTPDCSDCSGTVCKASSADVSVKMDGVTIETQEMLPGETHEFGWSNEDLQHVLQVKLISGEASSDSCPAYAGMVGPQAVSDFTIYDTQKSTILEAETEAQEQKTALTTVPPTTAATTEPVQTTAATPTQSGFGPVLIIVAGTAGCALFAIKRR